METLEEQEKIVIVSETGEKVECDIIFTFTSDDTGKAYVGYTDNKLNNEGKKNIFVSAFDPVVGFDTLEPITTNEEWDMVNDVLKQIREDNSI